MLAGMDEAGRGPVIGPLVVAGVAATEIDLFAALGCTDSKVLSPDRRRALDRALRREAAVKIEVRTVDADVLDAERREGRSLNVIEMRRFQDIAVALGATTVWVDAADVDAQRFGAHLAAALPPGTTVVSEHKADVTYPIVGAASIIAKVERDAQVAKLARRLERKLNLPLGSGYSSDPLTQAFLRGWLAAFGELPEGTRLTWATARDLLAPKNVRLDGFA
ncbi:MAG: ribonuclease HII [bacterium]